MNETAATRPTLLVAHGDISRFREAVPTGIHLFGVITVTTDTVTLADEFDQPFDISIAPMLCLGMFATQQSSLALLEQAQAVFSTWSAFEFAAPKLIPLNKLRNRVELMLATNLVEQINLYASYTTRLSRELARLRASHEDLHNAFASIEAFLGTSNMQPCRLTFENLPAGDDNTFLSRAGGGFRQLLPVSSDGISVIELHISSEGAEFTPSDFLIELQTIEDREVHGVWDIKSGQHQGWITLPLRKAIGGLKRTLEIVITPSDPNSAIPGFSLGSPQAASAFRIRSAAEGQGALIEKSLAMRTWAGLPGVRPPTLNGMASIGRDLNSALVREIILPLDAVRQLDTGWSPDFPPIQSLHDVRGLICHPPPPGMMTVGVLIGLRAREVARISARVSIGSTSAAPVEFAMVFSDLPAETVTAALEINKISSNKTAYTSTGWTRVFPGSSVLLTMEVLPNDAGQANLFLATRMPDGNSNDFAWAIFADLRHVLLNMIDFPGSMQSVSIPTKPNHRKLDAIGDFLEISAPILSTVSEVKIGESTWNNIISPVQYDYDRRGIIVHPPTKGVMLARIHDFVPPSADIPLRLAARLQLANDRSFPVEMCIAISTLPEEELEHRLNNQLFGVSSPWFTSSGWQQLAAMEEVWIELDSPSGESEKYDIYFATRMAKPDDNNEFAWAFITDLRVITHMAGPLLQSMT